MSKLEKILLLATFTAYGLITIFSYAYVDLNLTLTKNELVLKIVSSLQQIGYFNRPQATIIFALIIFISFILFVFNLILALKGSISIRFILISTAISTLVLFFSYPFLSSDLFNYIFDAKILLTYHANPYTHKALDFPQDDWIRFMRWTHRYSPYGPIWLLISLIPSLIGFGKFITTLFAFKIFIGIFHLLNTWLIYKILKIINPKQQNLGTAMYGLNPIFLIEGVANAHNDVMLATFILLSVYLFALKKSSLSIFANLTGTLVKYIPLLNLPILLLFTFKKIGNAKTLIILNFITFALFTYLYSSFKVSVPFISAGATQVQFQPWYLFWTLPFLALIPSFATICFSILISLGAQFRYLPFLYYGDWTHPGSLNFMMLMVILPICIFTLLVLIKFKIGHGKS